MNMALFSSVSRIGIRHTDLGAWPEWHGRTIQDEDGVEVFVQDKETCSFFITAGENRIIYMPLWVMSVMWWGNRLRFDFRACWAGSVVIRWRKNIRFSHSSSSHAEEYQLFTRTKKLLFDRLTELSPVRSDSNVRLPFVFSLGQHFRSLIYFLPEKSDFIDRMRPAGIERHKNGFYI